MSLAQLSSSVVVAAVSPKREGIRKHINFHMPSAVPSRTQSGAILSFREHQVITYLRTHPGAYVPRVELAEFIWGEGADPRFAAMVVRQVRQKLGSSFVDSSAFGYRLTNSRAASLSMVCSSCGSAAINYSDEWVCYGCVGTQAADLDVGRTAYAEGTRSGKPWTEAEKEYVLAHVDDLSLDELGEGVNRTGDAVRGFLAQLGIKKKYVRRTG